jgi:hypothetical protein
MLQHFNNLIVYYKINIFVYFIMVLISVQSVENGNGYQFKNDFSETLEIDPKATISVVNVLFERDNNYIVDLTNNQFTIQIATAPSVELSIATGTYTAVQLAEEIQRVLHIAYYNQGIFFEVSYSTKDKPTFTIEYSYQPFNLYLSTIENWGNNIGANVTNASGNVDFSQITNGTPEFSYAEGSIETTIVPKIEYGGTYLQCQFNTTGDYPITPGAPPASYGGIVGLWSNTIGTAPTSVVAEITADITYLDVGMVFWSNSATVRSVKFIESGTQIGSDIPFELLDGDMLEIRLAPDSNANKGVPEYWYKRKGGSWRPFIISPQNQTFRESHWKGRSLKPFFGSDNKVDGTTPYFNNIKYTASGGSLLPINIKTDMLLEGHTLESNNLTRSVYGTGEISTNNVGLRTAVLNAGVSSEIVFQVPVSDVVGTGHLILSIIDENQLQTNISESATEVMGDSWYGNTTTTGGTVKTDGTTNPCIGAIYFDPVAKTIIRRSQMNGPSGDSVNIYTNPKLAPESIPIAVDKDNWTNDTTFTVRILADSNELVILQNKDGNPAHPSNELYTGKLLLTNTISGLGSVYFATAGSGWTNGESYYFYHAANKAVLKLIAGADGTMTGTGANYTIEHMGSGYEAADAITLIYIDGATGEPITSANINPTLTVNTLWTYDLTTTFSTDYKAIGINGYRYVLTKPTWVGDATASQSSINISAYKSQTNIGFSAPIVRFFPKNPDISFATMLGFGKDNYTFNGNSSIESDTTPNGNDLNHSEIVINVDNLPIKTYIGKAYKALSTINTNPIGSQQGITRAIAVLPRSLEANGVDGTTGPYYYDYFPYSVPLHNATELNLNELELTIRNPDGTLATDIIKANILLNISHVDNMGEGLRGGDIGNPINAPRSYDMLNIGKTLRATDAPSKPGNAHIRADTFNTAIKSGPNKTNAL